MVLCYYFSNLSEYYVFKSFTTFHPLLSGPQSPCERTDVRMAIVADHLGLSWTGEKRHHLEDKVLHCTLAQIYSICLYLCNNVICENNVTFLPLNAAFLVLFFFAHMTLHYLLLILKASVLLRSVGCAICSHCSTAHMCTGGVVKTEESLIYI